MSFFFFAVESETNVMSGLVLPQMTDELKSEITERITSKTLTEMHIAISPSVSYE
jgi:hypothetical protein